MRKMFDFLLFSLLKLHFQHLIFAKIQYNEFLSLIIGFLPPYEQKFIDITMLYCAKIFLKDVSSVKSLIFYSFRCKKLHFQHLIFAKIQYIEFQSIIIGFLQPYEQKLVDITMLYSAKLFLKDVSTIKCLIFYRFSMLKLYFQHLIFDRIWYNKILTLIIGFLQP